MHTQRGVTLVELAIGLVIIALLVAGLLAGQTLLKGGRVRGIITEVEDYRGAFLRFEEKYQDLPGDMTDATSKFTGTSNGDGNEQIPWNTSAGTNEGALAWQHLQLAQMIGTATMSGTGTRAVIGTNVPASRIPAAGYYVQYESAIGNYIGFGAMASSGVNNNPVLKPEDAQTLDLKIDDGAPLTGRVQAVNAGSCIASSRYDMAQTVVQCSMKFKLDNKL